MIFVAGIEALTAMLQFDPHRRISCVDALELPYFAEYHSVEFEVSFFCQSTLYGVYSA
jgi:hypothetical protein